MNRQSIFTPRHRYTVVAKDRGTTTYSSILACSPDDALVECRMKHQPQPWWPLATWTAHPAAEATS